MKAADRLKERFGANVSESVASGRGARVDVPATAAGGAGDVSRHAGMNRLKAFAVPLDRIVPDPDQPRKEFDPDVIERLARSLTEYGQLQPCRVRWDGAGRVWVLIAGEQRFRAATLAGLPTLDCVEALGPTDPDLILDQQLIENCLRTDLKPVEQAAAFRRIIDRTGWTASQLAKHLNLNYMAVYRSLDLLKLPESVQASVDGGDLAPSSAAEIAKIKDPVLAAAVAERVVSSGMKRDEAAALVQKVQAATPSTTKRQRKPDPVTVTLGDTVVTVRWTRPSETTALASLKAAVKFLQGQGRGADPAA